MGLAVGFARFAAADQTNTATNAPIATQAKGQETAAINTLTDKEKGDGWQLLFDGKTFNGWHNFHTGYVLRDSALLCVDPRRMGQPQPNFDAVAPGWQIKDGAIACVDPMTAGDIVTSNKFDWFELQLDYNISEEGNSGIMFHVADDGPTIWWTGPEFQLEDNEKAVDPVRCGWLYGLYQPANDPKTDKPLDATKPVGQWNHVRLLITPTKCEHDINGVKYVEYVLHSDDFNDRVKNSKFSQMPGFAQFDLGYIGLQGDHGSVSFRNIKIRPIKP